MLCLDSLLVLLSPFKLRARGTVSRKVTGSRDLLSLWVAVLGVLGYSDHIRHILQYWVESWEM